MTGSIFDIIEEEEPETGTIFDEVSSNPKIQKSENITTPWYKSWPSALGKGLLKGTVELGQSFGGMPEKRPNERQEEVEKTGEFLEKHLPSEEGFVETALEKGGKLFPSVVSGGGGLTKSAIQSGLAGASGATAKSVGASETVQSLAELPALLGPDLAKMIRTGKSNKEIVEFARSKGMTEDQITPLIQSEGKQRLLKRFSQKRGKAEGVLSETKEGLRNLYEDLSSNPSAKKTLSFEGQHKLAGDLKENLMKMPSKVRSRVAKDIKDYMNSGQTGEDLFNLYADINHNIGNKTKQLSLLKDPIKEALSKIDPSLGKDFDFTNKLYSNFHKISKTLKPSLASDIFEGTAMMRAVLGLSTGNPWILKEAIFEKAGKKIATNLLLNPRFQNLQMKMIDALNQNKFSAASKVWESMSDEMEDVDKETAKRMREIDVLKAFED